MRTLKIGAAALVLAAAVIAGPRASVSSAQVAPPPTGTIGHGCPSGAFCIYPGRATWSTGPEAGGIYYSYGAHNLHNQYGWHLVYNNQYRQDGVAAGVSFCYGYNGTGGEDNGIEGKGAELEYLTPINSITLWLYEYSFSDTVVCHL